MKDATSQSEVSDATSPQPSREGKQFKGILQDVFRSKSPTPAPPPPPKEETQVKGKKEAAAESSKVVDLAESKDVTPSAKVKRPTRSNSTSVRPEDKKSKTSKKDLTENSEGIASEWDAVVEALMEKRKKNIFGKMKRLGSRDGKGKLIDEEDEKTMDERLSDAISTPLPEITSTPSPKPLGPDFPEYMPGSNTLGRRIQKILSSVPPFYHTVPDTTDAPTPPPTDSQAPSITDSKLLTFLSSPVIMNGVGAGAVSIKTPDKDLPAPPVEPHASVTVGPPLTSKNERSVWSVLDRLVPYSKPKQETGSAEGEAETSIMLCAPLIVNENSRVTLARSQFFDINVLEQQQQAESLEAVLPKAVAKDIFSALWPEKFKKNLNLKRKNTKEREEEEAAAEETTGASTEIPVPEKPTLERSTTGSGPSQLRVWIPSKTNLSLQVAWWGYRLWVCSYRYPLRETYRFLFCLYSFHRQLCSS